MTLVPKDQPRPLPETMDGHALEHFFKGVCICPCKRCTHHSVVPDGKGHRGKDVMICTCPPCPSDKCGAKVGV